MCTGAYVALLLALVGVTPVHVRTNLPPVQERGAGPLDNDKRLAERIKLQPGVGLRLQVVVSRLASALELDLRCESSLGKRLVALAALKDQPARDWMQALAVVSCAEWVQTRGGYILCRIPALAGLAGLSEDELLQNRSAEARELLASLSAPQLAKLERSGTLAFDELDGLQKQRALKVAASAVVYSPDTYSADSLTGKGIVIERAVEMRGLPGGDAVRQLVIRIMLPSDIFISEEAFSYDLP